MTRRSRRASSAPQRVGSDEGLTSTRPRRGDDRADAENPGEEGPREAASGGPVSSTDRSAGADATSQGDTSDAAPARPGPAAVEQTTDDTDEGWGERRDGDASARWLRENRPPHWS